MAAPGAQTDRTGPVFFFDQPTRRNRIKGTQNYILRFSQENGGGRMEAAAKSYPKEGQECKRHNLDKQKLPDEPREDDKPSADCRPIDAYKRAAPHLLDELAHLLSQHKWSEKGCIPHGIVNILNESWHDMTAGASLHLGSPTLTDKRPKSKSSLKMEQTTPNRAPASEETGERSLCDGGKVDSTKTKSQVRSHVKTCKLNFSEGGITQPRLPSRDEPLSIGVCQWVVGRLQAARNPENTQTSDLKKPLLLRHYGDARVKLERRGMIKRGTLGKGVPQGPEVKLQEPVRLKLHYRVDDGSSFIYYPSGCVAVCQSHSGLPCGGFYTNVFSDGERPVTMATITVFGRGAVTDPLSSTITAAWNQDGGLFYDDDGNKTKEWSWQKHHTLKSRITVQVSDQISVALFSGTSAILSFKCDDESVELPLSSLSYSQSMQMTKEKFDSAQDVQQLKEKKCPAGVSESKENLRQTPVSVCLQGFLQMFREVEGPVELPARSRREGHAGRELKRLQQRARNTVDDWLDCYRGAIGIRCPEAQRMSAAPLRTRRTKTIQVNACRNKPHHEL